MSTSTSGKYNLTIAGNLTDHSDVPVTQIKFAIKQTGTSRNVSVKVSGIGSRLTERFVGKGGGGNSCCACKSQVYGIEGLWLVSWKV